ncbi:hypothetical protein LEMLEM_LOCUS13892 [Lemmus lemmus]
MYREPSRKDKLWLSWCHRHAVP